MINEKEVLRLFTEFIENVIDRETDSVYWKGVQDGVGKALDRVSTALNKSNLRLETKAKLETAFDELRKNLAHKMQYGD